MQLGQKYVLGGVYATLLDPNSPFIYLSAGLLCQSASIEDKRSHRPGGSSPAGQTSPISGRKLWLNVAGYTPRRGPFSILATTDPRAVIKLKGYGPVPTDQIRFIQADSNYVNIYLADQTFFVHALNLGKMAQRLPGFLHVHQSLLINPLFVESYANLRYEKLLITLRSGEQVRVAKRRYAYILNQITSAEKKGGKDNA